MSLKGAGAIRFWGFSPALDLSSALAAATPDDDAPLRVLLMCPSDVRHMLRTLASASVAASGGAAAAAPIEFSVYENFPEALARQLLLLSIILDVTVPRRERAELFLEVLANTSVRDKTAAYVSARAQALRRLLAHDEGPLAAIVDVSQLKMKDRDALEEVLGTYLEGVPFDVVRLRDERLRSFYQDRYDVRKNVLDWDYTMELKENGASIIHKARRRHHALRTLLASLQSLAAAAAVLAAAASLGRCTGASGDRRASPSSCTRATPCT